MNRPLEERVLRFLVLLMFLLPACGDDGDREQRGSAMVVISSDSLVLLVGETIQLTAVTLNGTDGAYEWKSSSPGIATVDGTGEVTARAEGEITIAAIGLDSGASGTIGLTVTRGFTPGEAEVVITAVERTVNVGETLPLTATTLKGDDSAYAWESSDILVATVDQSGVVTARAPGEVVITATGTDTDASGTFELMVREAPSEEVVVVTGERAAILVGETLMLQASTVNGDDSAYAWGSSDNGIARVSQTGLVTAVAPGEAVISATGVTTGASGSYRLAVVSDQGGQAVVVVTAGHPFVLVGETLRLSAITVNGEDSAYVWEASDDGVATVDQAGLVTGVDSGEVTILATGLDTGATGSVGLLVFEDGLDIP